MKKRIIKLIILSLTVCLTTQAQKIYSHRSVNDGNFPNLKWYSAIFQNSEDFQIYRSGLEKVDFQPVKTLHGKDFKGDTIIYWVIDTTLTKQALYKYFITVPYANDSISRSEIMFGHNMGAMPSPQVIRFNANPAAGKKAIDLTWELNYKFTTNTLSLLRSTRYDDGYEVIATLPGDAEKYTDLVDVSNEAYFYFILIHDYFGYQTPSVRIHGMATHKEKPIPPQNFKAANANNSAELSWERVGSNIVGYRIYRKVNKSGSYFPLDKIFYEPEIQVNYIDSTIKDFKNIDIAYYVVSVSDGFVESNPTDTILVHVQGDIVKTAPKECDYVIDSLGHVMIIWTSQEEDVEVKGYNIYRSIGDSIKVKLNKHLIPYNINYFVDIENKRTNEYIYEIESVSITNTPSLTKSTRRVNWQDAAPNLILSLTKTSNGIRIKGLPLTDPYIKEVVIYRQVNSGNLTQIKKLSPHNIDFTDVNVKTGELYSYTAVAVYQNNKMESVNSGVILRF